MEALQITVDSRSASFRNPLYSGVQHTLPCPPPSTVRGLLAGMAGAPSLPAPDPELAMSFQARGSGTDLEKYHRVNLKKKELPMVVDRQFLVHTTLTIWLFNDLEFWQRAARRPVWPVRMGRSQDLASARCRRVQLSSGPGRQGTSLVPASSSRQGIRLRVPSRISNDREEFVWGDYRYDAKGSNTSVGQLHTETGQAVVPLDSGNPGFAEK